MLSRGVEVDPAATKRVLKGCQKAIWVAGRLQEFLFFESGVIVFQFVVRYLGDLVPIVTSGQLIAKKVKYFIRKNDLPQEN